MWLKSKFESINWERVFHLSILWAVRWCCASFAFIGIRALVGVEAANQVIGMALGFYLISLVVEEILGGALQDDNSAVPKTALGRWLRKQIDGPTTTESST